MAFQPEELVLLEDLAPLPVAKELQNICFLKGMAAIS